MRARQDTVLHRSILVTESLVRFDWSALGLYCTKRNYFKWSVFSGPVTYTLKINVEIVYFPPALSDMSLRGHEILTVLYFIVFPVPCLYIP